MAQNLRIEDTDDESSEPDIQLPEAEAHDLTLRKSIAELLRFHDITSIQASTLSSLTAICQRLLIDLARKSRSYAEVSQRSSITENDLFLTLINENVDLSSLMSYTKFFQKNKSENKVQTVIVPEQSKALSAKEKEEKFDNLDIGPRKRPIQIANSSLNIPDFPDGHTYKRTRCYNYSEEQYDVIAEAHADRKMATMTNIAKLYGKVEYSKGRAFAHFGGAEISKANDKDGDNDWSIIPVVLNNPEANSSVSVMAQGLVPRPGETELLLKDDPYLATRKPLKPKKQTKKLDGRSRSAREQREKLAREKEKENQRRPKMLRFSKPSFKKWGTKGDLRAPRRNKEYKYVYAPHLRPQESFILEATREQKDNNFAKNMLGGQIFESIDHQRSSEFLTHVNQTPSYRVAGLVDPFINELYMGRLNQDWLNPFPSLDNEHEALSLTTRRGDLLDKLVSLEEVEEEALEKLKQMKVMNLDHHFDIGGQSYSEMEALHLTETFSKDLALLTTFRFLKHFGMKSVLYGASDEVLAHYMEDLTSLKRTIGFCMAEPHARSDISEIQTRAWRDVENPDQWLLTGKKSKVLVHPNTDLFVVFAQTQKGPEDKQKLSAFLVDLKNASGTIEVIDAQEEIEIDGLKFCNVVFSDVSVPETHLLGELGEGFHLAQVLQALSRYSIGAEFAEIQRVLLQYMSRYCHYTEQFGKRLEEFPLVQQRLSEIGENVYICESMAYWLLGAGKLTEIENGSQFSQYMSEANAVQLMSKKLALESVHHSLELLGTRALSPTGRIIFDQIFNIYASATFTGASDVLSLYNAQAGFQHRFHFDKEYFTHQMGGDPTDGIYRARVSHSRHDRITERNNFTDDWKDAFTGLSEVWSTISRQKRAHRAGGWRAWGRHMTQRKIEGVLAGRYTKQGQRSHIYTEGWLESMLGKEFEVLVTDCDDFGKRVAMLMQTHGHELENFQITLKRTSDVACNIFAVAAAIARCNKSARLGFNYYEDEISLCGNIVRRFSFRNKVAMHEMMPWNQKAAMIDENTEHIGKQIIANGGYHFQPAVALKFDYQENPEYLDKLESLRELGSPDREKLTVKKLVPEKTIDLDEEKTKMQEKTESST